MAFRFLLSAAIAAVAAQQIGTAIPEVHPQLPTQFCTKAGGCVVKRTSLVVDALYHPFHVLGDAEKSCNPNPTPTQDRARMDPAICPDEETCARNCVFEGADYEKLGIKTDGSALTLRLFRSNGTGWARAPNRVYLLAEDEQNYESMQLINQEFTFDVDMSLLVCGTNGALYMDEMDMSGNRHALNPAGASYGTGYCDAQCYNKTLINGVANLDNSGACCNEMDIWEANAMATALTPHMCSQSSSFKCQGDACGKTDAGVCDKAGCGINPYKTVGPTFYGPGLAVDTKRPFTVVTQFLTADNTTTGVLTNIKRQYIQDGKVVEVPVGGRDSIDQDYCTASGPAAFNRLGGMKAAGESLARGMVLTFSLWASPGDFMHWLDSGSAGPCGPTDGDPAKIAAANPDVTVTWSNIRWGEIGSTV